MSKIKVCGLSRRDDIKAVNEARPDFCGFIIEVKKSSRCISREKVKELKKELHPDIIPVGVFVDAPVELVAELLEDGMIEMAQLHGKEDERYIERLREITEKPLIKAFSIKTKEDMEEALQSSADYILLDQGSGGTGKTFDWSLVPKIERPFFLAGGLGKENLKQAIETLNPWAVDLSSSLETAGKKDREKILRAVELVRSV